MSDPLTPRRRSKRGRADEATFPRAEEEPLRPTRKIIDLNLVLLY